MYTSFQTCRATFRGAHLPLLLCVSSLLGVGCREASQQPAEIPSVGSIGDAPTAVSGPDAPDIRWAESFSAAQSEALESGKPIFVAFNTMELGNPHSPNL